MEENLAHEDLLIKLRAKLNERKIKLWEPPYTSNDGEISQSLQELTNRLASELSLDLDVVRNGLLELQQHSLERSKANEEFKETGCATLRIKATGKGDKGVVKVMKKLTVSGSELIETVAQLLGIEVSRLKLICNGKVIKPTVSLEEQGVKNGMLLMALMMAETPDESKKEDDMYVQMKSTLDDATLLSECVDDLNDDEDYMNLEDQTGRAVELPKSERRSLFVGLALHERGRTCIHRKEYSLALILLLEADRQLSECQAQILTTVDNYAVLQLDIAWCYLCLQSLQAANDASERLSRAEVAFANTYGNDHERLIALKGTDANERVLYMRLYLLQGIVAYHQNKRTLARSLLEKAERELTNLHVDGTAVETLMELGWSRGQACAGLRAGAGDPQRAQHYLERHRAERDAARARRRHDREQRALGVCIDGRPVSDAAVRALTAQGFARRRAIAALTNTNNNLEEAERLLRETPELLQDSDLSDEEESSSEDLEPDNKLLSELEAMGYSAEQARAALQASGNDVTRALDFLLEGKNQPPACDPANPSTSTSSAANRKRQKKGERTRKKKARDEAIRRLRQTIRQEEEDYLNSTLSEEEHFLVQYKSLL